MKEMRSCTQHPIIIFVSYEGLSLNYKVFPTTLTEIQIHMDVKEGLIQREWKKSVLEEITLEEQNMGIH